MAASLQFMLTRYSSAGPALMGGFVAFVAARDVFFAATFQVASFFVVVAVSFGLCTAVFLIFSVARNRADLRRALAQWPEVVAANATTAAAWLCYFAALGTTSPSVVNTLHAGIGPATILAIEGLGFAIARAVPVSRAERRAQMLVLLSIMSLAAWTGLSGAGGALGALLALASGIFITLATLFVKRLNEKGLLPETVLALRFVLITAIAVTAVAMDPDATLAAAEAVRLVVAAMALIVLPVYLAQLGLALTSPITASVIMSTGPLFIFALQSLEGRVPFSGVSLALIVAYCAIAATTAFLRGSALRARRLA